ncbi:MAG: S41 family peptidase [Verrucomicrobiota bacterium]|jgi:tricorn protease
MKPTFAITRFCLRRLSLGAALAALWAPALPAQEEGGAPQGYYRFPALHGDTVVFTAEGDLWRVSVQGGMAQRLTSNLGTESHAAFSPDGKTLAFSAEYEGPTEVYTMPAEGGLPTRRTFGARGAEVVGWTPDGKVLYSTTHLSGLPDRQLATIDLKSGEQAVLPLSQASAGVFDPTGKTLYFVRLPFQGSSTKRYQGGTIQHLWKFTAGEPEAVPLTEDFAGTSKAPMWWQGRIYFVSDRDGWMNLWSMSAAGGDLQQATRHKSWDVKSPSLSEGRIVYQLGADLRLLDIASKADRLIPITLATDLDQEREKWVQKPMDYLTTAHLSPDGDRLVLTARGQVFTAPAEEGRLAEATHDASVRFRGASFMPDGKSLVALSDATGELEFYRIPANGVGQPEQLTADGKVFRFDGVASPDGKWLAYGDKDWQLWILNLEEKKSRRVAASEMGEFSDLTWSPDSQWLAYVRAADNTYAQIWLYEVKTGTATALTSDRVNSYNPVWSPDGKWMYLLSERHLESAVSSPWGSHQPEPFFDLPVGLYHVALAKDQRSPFEPPDELHPPEKEKKKDAKEKGDETNAVPVVTIDLPGIQTRVEPVPVPTGNYRGLAMSSRRLFLQSPGTGLEGQTNVTLRMLEVTNKEPQFKTLAEQVKSFELSADRKKILLRKEDNFYVLDADASAPVKLEKHVPLSDWTFPLNPRKEWRQMFTEAWRLERDFFYDRKMHGVDWPAVLRKNLPLVDRVTDREELSDLISEMVGELSALHIFVRGGDERQAADKIKVGALGARLVRDRAAGGYRVAHIYASDPDYPERNSPLARPGVDIHEGDILEMINGVAVVSQPDLGALLANQAQRQVLLRIKTPPSATSRDVVVKPMTTDEEADLRYDEWEYARRTRVEELGKGELGYVHLRAMGGRDIAQWARDYYPVFQRKGLIVDVRHNRGGNIDSWILERLMRKAWFYWQGRVGSPYWNMQYAFRGHVVVLCDEQTASDGEAFTEGFKRLGLGKVIGTRTWGGEIWLSFDNWLVDKGIASAAEFGVYGPEGKWLIEGHGVDPDIVVDNPPHATYLGEDAQLKKAIDLLREEIKKEPVTVPPPPATPDKSWKETRP